jgi:hypothetical protein
VFLLRVRYEFSGYISDGEGVKQMLLKGKWNSYLDAVRCNEAGEALPDVTPRRLWTASLKPEKVGGESQTVVHDVIW